MVMEVDVPWRWIDYWLDRQRTMAIVAVLSQFKLFTVKDVIHYRPLLLTLTPLSMLILWGV